MKDQGESTKQLKNESVELRQINAELEKSGIKYKQVKELLQENQERYKAFFDRSLCCVCMHDLEGRFLDANKAALSLLKSLRNLPRRKALCDSIDWERHHRA